MARVLRGCRATMMALAVTGVGQAHAEDLVWAFGQDDVSAFVGVIPAGDEPEADYPFYMACSVGGEETTVVSAVDAVALGEAIAKGEVPSFSFVIDGTADPDAGGYVAELRFEQMNGVWQYVVEGADYDLLLTATKSITIDGTGVHQDLPETDMLASLEQFKAACDAMNAGDGEGGGDSAEEAPPPQ